MLGSNYRGSSGPLNDAIMSGPAFIGARRWWVANNPKVTQDKDHIDITAELLKNDVLVVQTGCGALRLVNSACCWARLRWRWQPGLREVRGRRHPSGAAHGLVRGQQPHPDRADQMATEGGLGDDVSDLPAVGTAPGGMSEKALAIGTLRRSVGRLRPVRRRVALRVQRRGVRPDFRGLGGHDGRQDGVPTDRRRSSAAAWSTRQEAELKLPVYDPPNTARAATIHCATTLSYRSKNSRLCCTAYRREGVFSIQ